MLRERQPLRHLHIRAMKYQWRTIHTGVPGAFRNLEIAKPKSRGTCLNRLVFVSEIGLVTIYPHAQNANRNFLRYTVFRDT